MGFRGKIPYILCFVFALVLILGNIPSFAAYEAHVINVTATIRAPIIEVLVSKVYYDVDSEHSDLDAWTGDDEANEWIELYNSEPTQINLKEWQICNKQICAVLSSTDLYLPAGGFAVVSRNESTWQYWNIPDDVLKITLSSPAFYLANDGDRVLLKDHKGKETDKMSYGTDIYGFDPSCPDVIEGNALGRKPSFPGYQDTDTNADWQDFGLPQVTVTYPLGGIWYCGYDVVINWTATNPNGPDEDLSIDIIYITDNDSSGTLSSNDEAHFLAEGISNSGTYPWQVSICYFGYIWVEVVATGPENPMLSGHGFSGRVFEPPAPEDPELETSGDSFREIDMTSSLHLLTGSNLPREEQTTTREEDTRDILIEQEALTQEEPLMQEEPSIEEDSLMQEESLTEEESLTPEELLIEQAPLTQEDSLIISIVEESVGDIEPEQTPEEVPEEVPEEAPEEVPPEPVIDETVNRPIDPTSSPEQGLSQQGQDVFEVGPSSDQPSLPSPEESNISVPSSPDIITGQESLDNSPDPPDIPDAVVIAVSDVSIDNSP